MKTAEDQIWDKAREIEQARVDARKAEMKKQGKVSKAEFRAVAKPWTWGSSEAHSLYNISPILVFSVVDFDFDLDDEAFVGFLKDHFHLHMCRKRESAYWNALNDHGVTKAKFLANKDFQFAQEYEGKRYKYDDAELLQRWELFYYVKVFLQGAYDRFRARGEGV